MKKLLNILCFLFLTPLFTNAQSQITPNSGSPGQTLDVNLSGGGYYDFVDWSGCYYSFRLTSQEWSSTSINLFNFSLITT